MTILCGVGFFEDEGIAADCQGYRRGILDEFDAGEGVAADEEKVYAGPVEYREFDPLGRGMTLVTWKSTKGGTAFLAGGTHAYLFLAEWPAPGQWSVCWCTTSAFDPPLTERVLDHRWFAMAGQKPRAVGMTVHRGIPKDVAVEVAEELAGCFDMDLSSRKARWRGKQASEKLLHKARTLGVARTASYRWTRPCTLVA